MPTNLQTIFGGGGGFDGIIGVNTASFYRLDPTCTVPIEPIIDIVPGVTPFRITLDMIDNESKVQSYRVTTNTLQDFSDVTPNCHKDLVQIAITGVLSACAPMSIVGLPPLPTFGARLDLLRIGNLERLADLRRPIMCVTPRVSLARCWITSITRPWVPLDGESTPVTITVLEARIAAPFNTGVLPDTDSLDAGNTQTTGGGEQSAGQVTTAGTESPPVEQLPPGTHPNQTADW